MLAALARLRAAPVALRGPRRRFAAAPHCEARRRTDDGGAAHWTQSPNLSVTPAAPLAKPDYTEVVVTNLHPSVTLPQLTDAFEAVCETSYVLLSQRRATLGNLEASEALRAFVTLKSRDDALRAVSLLDGADVAGRQLRVRLCDAPKRPGARPGGGGAAGLDGAVSGQTVRRYHPGRRKELWHLRLLDARALTTHLSQSETFQGLLDIVSQCAFKDLNPIHISAAFKGLGTLMQHRLAAIGAPQPSRKRNGAQAQHAGLMVGRAAATHVDAAKGEAEHVEAAHGVEEGLAQGGVVEAAHAAATDSGVAKVDMLEAAHTRDLAFAVVEFSAASGALDLTAEDARLTAEIQGWPISLAEAKILQRFVAALVQSFQTPHKRRFEGWTPWCLVSALGGLAKLPLGGETGTQVFDAFTPLVLQHLQTSRMMPSEVANVAWAYAKMGRFESGDTRVYDALRGRIYSWLDDEPVWDTDVNSVDVGQLSWSLAQSPSPDLNLLRRMTRPGAKLRLLNGQGLAKVAWALAKTGAWRPPRNGPVDHRTFKVLSAQATKRIDELNAQEAALLVWACAVVRFEAPGLFDVVQTKALQDMADFQAESLVLLSWAFAKARCADGGAALVLEAVAETFVRDRQKLARLKPGEIAMLLWAFGHASRTTVASHALFQLVANGWDVCVFEQPMDLAILAWAYAKQNVARPRFFNRLAVRLLPLVPRCNAQDLSNTAWAFARVGLFDFEAEEGDDCDGDASHRLFAAIAAETSRKISTFTATDLAQTAWSFATAGFQAPALFDKIADETRLKLHTFKAQELSYTAWAYSQPGHADADQQARLMADLERLMGDVAISRPRAHERISDPSPFPKCLGKFFYW
ncbi:hypothetical protein M885DRAFT_545088 [Pelagophyceae sp. CCMP2097]|nr:hypothetical protein M885DRAFT_545088 [Pelagophyceae sp. CCMP2097]